MAQLFKDRLIKDVLIGFEIPSFENKLAIVRSWAEAAQNKSLEKQTESQCEQAFNNDFFVKILGYAPYPNTPCTIEVKPATETSSQKPDGRLGIFNPGSELTVAVVEIKDANTFLDKPQKRKNQETPVQQGFRYKPQYRECDFVIVTNFIEIRIYKDNQLDYEKFTLTELVDPKDDYFQFRKFYYLLCQENFLPLNGASTVQTLLSGIRVEQEKITKKFYSDYKSLRKELIKDIVKNNHIPKAKFAELAVEKAQKIIDRIVFISFCEDLGLLPEDKLQEVIHHANKVGMGIAVWDLMKGFFNAIDSGSEKLGIPNGYNGELFKPDAVLDSLKIGDEICNKFIEIGKYDFTEDLSVNILGRIFEQSISDLEEIKSLSIEGLEGSVSKRKKDGIFYTPEYIVDFIVKNSLGGYLLKKEEDIRSKHGLRDDIQDKNYLKRAIVAYEEYQQVVIDVKVLDPACGSGAFLVKVFDFLLEENKRISTILNDLKGGTSWIDTEEYFRSILQNNIYGVDLNAESVEITKLSLWLKTASKGHKLTSLKNNIKCGNSLIEDFSVAGHKSFVWSKEFPDIMNNGGFDVILGNPPYLRLQGIQSFHKESAVYFSENYSVATANFDLYLLFVERGYKLLKKEGVLSYILPHKFLVANFGEGLRGFLLENKAIDSIVSFGDHMVFHEADTYTCILTLKADNKSPSFRHASIDPANLNKVFDLNEFEFTQFSKNTKWVFGNQVETQILDYITRKNKRLMDFCLHIYQGMITGKDEVFCLSGDVQDGYLYLPNGKIELGILRPHLRGKDVQRYQTPQADEWLLFPYEKVGTNVELMSEETLRSNYPFAYQYLLQFKDVLRSRESGSFDDIGWYRFSRNQALSVFQQDKILTPEICDNPCMTLDQDSLAHNSKVHGIVLKNTSRDSILSTVAILNSKVFWFFIKRTGNILRGGYFGIKKSYIAPFPFPSIKVDEMKSLSSLVEEIIDLNNRLNGAIKDLIEILVLKNPTRKKFIQNGISAQTLSMSFDEFSRITHLDGIPYSETEDLLNLFRKYSALTVEITNRTTSIEAEIEQQVMALYKLQSSHIEYLLKNV